jgi:NADPH:quinone reductase-like Zn-dependent oxidoreductase
MRVNGAAWQPPNHARLQTASARYTPPRENEIVVENRAIAVNPLEWILQCSGNVVFPWIKYPFVFGSDLAGEVVEVGKSVCRFRVGDRVLAHAVGTDKSRNREAEGAFQRYTVVLEHMTSPIPESLPYENACVLPLGISTAACGLFKTNQLGLHPPSLSPQPRSQTVLIWGGSTSVGMNAIQLAVAAGHDVIATASPQNFEYLRKLGAAHVFNYASLTVIDDLVEALRSTTVAGALAIGDGAADGCLRVLRKCKGNKVVSITSFPMSFERMPRGSSVMLHFMRQMPRVLRHLISLFVKSRSWGIRTRSVFATSIVHNEVSRLIYEEFLPNALSAGRYIPAPAPQISGEGLDSIQDAHNLGIRQWTTGAESRILGTGEGAWRGWTDSFMTALKGMQD